MILQCMCVIAGLAGHYVEPNAVITPVVWQAMAGHEHLHRDRMEGPTGTTTGPTNRQQRRKAQREQLKREGR